MRQCQASLELMYMGCVAAPQADTSLVNRPPNNDGQAENNFGWLLFAEVAQ